MSLYLIGRAVAGFIMAWGSGLLFVYLVSVFPDRQAVFIIFTWTWILGFGTLIAHLLDWRKTSSVKLDALAVIAVGLVAIFFSYLVHVLFIWS